jgi:membrane protease YdiL (CAAX protease family)
MRMDEKSKALSVSRFVAVMRALLWILAFSVFGALVYFFAILVFGSNVDVIAVTCVADFMFAAMCLSAAKGAFDVRGQRATKVMPPIVLVLLLIPVIWLVGVFASTWVAMLPLGGPFGYRDVSMHNSPMAVVCLLSFLFAPLVEEVVCRGAVWSCLRGSFGAVSTAVIASLLFAGMHLSIAHVPHTFILGLILCLLRERGWPLFGCMAVHATFNALSLFVSPHLQMPEFVVSTPFVIVSFAAVVAALIWMISIAGREPLLALPEHGEDAEDVTEGEVVS